MTPFVPVIVSMITAATFCGPLVLEDLLEVRRARADRARIRVPGGAAVRVRIEHPDDARHARARRASAAGRPSPRSRPPVAPWYER